eukprot:jgi/Antlo1/763/593
MVKATVARENSDYNRYQQEDYYDYTNYKIEYGNIEDYRIYKRVARGKYSEVFEGRIVKVNGKEKVYDRCIIKVLKPIRISKINREVKVLRTLEHSNIIKLLDVVVDQDSQTHSLLFEYLNHQNTTNLFKNLPMCDVKHYSRQILEAMRYCHSKGIMHRDLKPQNLLIDPETKHVKIIDWGLAEFYHPGTEYAVKVATRYYKSPELLVNYTFYDYSLDIWSFGCILAEMLFNTRPFFFGNDNLDQLYKIVSVLGTHEFLKYIKHYDIELSKEVKRGLPENKKICFEDFFGTADISSHHTKAADLLDKILVYDHQKRLTARECLDHPFLR